MVLPAAIQEVTCVPMRLSKGATGVFGELPDQSGAPMPHSELSEVLKELNAAARSARLVVLQVAGAALLLLGLIIFGCFRVKHRFDGEEDADASALERGAAWFTLFTLPGALLLAAGARQRLVRIAAFVLVMAGSFMQLFGYAAWIDMQGEEASQKWGSWGLALSAIGTLFGMADCCQSACCLDLRTVKAVNRQLSSIAARYKNQGVHFELRHSPLLSQAAKDGKGDAFALIVQATST
jgi:hypothetical protein